MNRFMSLGLVCAALALYCASLLIPAFSYPSSKSLPGYSVLATGWAGLIGADPRWLANLGFVYLAFCGLNARQVNKFIMIATVLLAIAAFAPAAGCEASGGAPGTSDGLALGGHLWVVSMLLVAAGR